MTEKIQAKFNGLISLDEHLDKDSSYSMAFEQCAVKRIETKEIAEEEGKITTYILENLGRTNILAEKDSKPYLIKGKPKNVTKSQILRLKIEADGLDYDKTMNTIIDNYKRLL